MSTKNIWTFLSVKISRLSNNIFAMLPKGIYEKELISSACRTGWWAIQDSNLRPQSYQDCALTS